MSSVSTTGRFHRFRRWLRGTWLGRVPWLRRFLGKADKPALPPKKQKFDTFELLQHEARTVANDPVGMAQVALFGGALAELNLRIPTPGQVLLNGWQSIRSPYDASPEPADDATLLNRM